MNEKFEKGMTVEVTHLAGKEIGVIDSINYRTGIVTLCFSEGINRTFCAFQISQIKAVA